MPSGLPLQASSHSRVAPVSLRTSPGWRSRISNASPGLRGKLMRVTCACGYRACAAAMISPAPSGRAPAGAGAETCFTGGVTVITPATIGVTHFGRFRYQPEKAMMASTGAARMPPARCSE